MCVKVYVYECEYVNVKIVFLVQKCAKSPGPKSKLSAYAQQIGLSGTKKIQL